MGYLLQNILGILLLFGIAYLISNNKRKFPLRIVLWGLGIQLVLALFVLKIPQGVTAFKWFGDKVSTFLGFAQEGSKFLFGNLINPGQFETFGFQFAIIVTATIIFFSSFVSVMYYYGIMQRVVYAMAWFMEKTMGTSGVESLSASANIFLGQTEAPLLIRHYLKDATMSEMNSIMTVGFATIAGSVLAAYVALGIDPTYLISACIISAPGGLILSKIAMPPEGKTMKLKDIKKAEIPRQDNLLTAITNGASDGLKLSLNIMAMLIAFISLIAVLDWLLGSTSLWLAGIGIENVPGSIREILGYIFMPFAYLVGIPAEEARVFGSLFGTKMAINEFIAFGDLSELIRSGAISQRTITISTFALCGFANFSSIAIQIGGLGSLVPERKSDIAKLGFKAMVIGSMTNLLTATIVSIFI